ncbi:hypothetical protein FM120_15690 [Sphingobacterium faecium PCAi_F2.5]|nr:hypothetical protein FM120_15690 [Sphingobacterium faecium PCAi_F2.5]
MKTQNKQWISLISIGLIMVICQGCKKYLEAKPNKNLTTAESLIDLQSLMDDYQRLNIQSVYAGEVSSDDYYVTETDLQSVTKEGDRRMYTWSKDLIFEPTSNSWQHCYLAIYYGNTVLEQLEKIDRNNQNASTWDNLYGQAVYYKGANLLNAAFTWAKAYDASTASGDLGLPIRSSTDFNEQTTRSNLEETYRKALSDLKVAVAKLPTRQISIIRPSKAAAYAMLSRAYLSMNQYESAGAYADSALQINSKLIDYNTISASATNPFPQFNAEVYHHWSMGNATILAQSRAKIVPALYAQYSADDLRKTIFFKQNAGGTYAFKGNYSGSTALFSGPAIDEMYLNRAESYARTGKVANGLKDLNSLLLNRWNKNKTYVPLTAMNTEEAISLILRERRKELLMRGLRWLDLKRLNKMGANITLERELGNNRFTLLPNDNRYALAIPEYVIQLSGIPQNPR